MIDLIKTSIEQKKIDDAYKRPEVLDADVEVSHHVTKDLVELVEPNKDLN